MKEVGGTPWMADEEIAFLDDQIQPTDHMCEWGGGGSTIWLAKRVDTLVTLEHDQEWHRALRERISNEPQINPWLYYLVGDPEPPVTEITTDVQNYLEDGTWCAGERHGPFDAVLIDGRARLYVAMAMLSHLRAEARVLIHDWDRERYHEALNWYEEMEVVGTLALLRPTTRQPFADLLRRTLDFQEAASTDG